jgi:hypothetical protein
MTSPASRTNNSLYKSTVKVYLCRNKELGGISGLPLLPTFPTKHRKL